jgi:hypothetical protein
VRKNLADKEMLKSILTLASFLSMAFGQTTGCSTTNCVFRNSYLRFGPGTQTSVNAHGLFIQPFYYSNITSQWYKLTFSNYPLDTAIGFGTSGPNWSGATVVDLYSLTPRNGIIDYSEFIVSSNDGTTTSGYGKIIATREFTVLDQNIIFQNTFSLGQNDSFVKIITQVTNNDTSHIQNIRIWVGTRDDYVGLTDSNIKTRGNLESGSFVAVTQANQSSHAIMITNPTEGVLFYSETPGVMTAYSSCCNFANAYNTYPLTLAPMTPTPTDGSYAAVLPIGNLSVGESTAITWYYAAGAISSLSSVAQSVASDQMADSGVLVAVTVSSTATASETLTATTTNTPTSSTTNTPTSSTTNTPTSSLTSSPSPTVSLILPCTSHGQNSTNLISSIPVKEAIFLSGISSLITLLLTSACFYLLFFNILLPCYQRKLKYNCPFCSKDTPKGDLRKHLIECPQHQKEYMRRIENPMP